MTIEMRGEASAYIDAAPERVYALVSDVTRMGEWSPECVGGSWVDGHASATVGAVFRGTNSRGGNEWTTPNTVIAADNAREFAWVVGTLEFRVCTWRYSLIPEGTGTRITESFELGSEEVGFASMVLERPPEQRQALVDARCSQLVEDMRQTLARLKDVAET